MGCAITSLLLHQSSQTRLPLILVVSPFWEDKDMNHENQLQAYLTLDPARTDSNPQAKRSSLEESCVCAIPGKP